MKRKNYCSICNNFTDVNLCIYCVSTTRDRSQICIVEEVFDLLSVENTRDYKGLYHILHGSLSPSRGISPDKLMIANIFPRLISENNEDVEVKKIIFATNRTFESEMTANYIERLIKPLGVSTSRMEIMRESLEAKEERIH